MEKEFDVFRMYINEVASICACDEEENARLAERAAAGDGAARNRLIEGNLRYALELSRDFMGKGVPVSDLVQEANMALVIAAEEYEPDCGSFREFAAGQVKAALRQSVKEHQAQSRVDEKVLERVNALQDVSKKMAEELGREATVPELAKRLKITEEEVKDIMKMALDALKVMGE